jgi:uncharacterized protein
LSRIPPSEVREFNDFELYSRRCGAVPLFALGLAMVGNLWMSKGTLLAVLLGCSIGRAATVGLGDDIPSKFELPTEGKDFVQREIMIPMRDGARLFTILVIPKNARNAAIVLTRTPYNASKHVSRYLSPHALAIVPQGDDVFVTDGYIRVFQDIRGKEKSEGTYVMTRPPRGPLNQTPVDESTDAWDTIDWLIKNIPESNGRVGMIGSSYEGFTVVMALLDPHPALKVAAPESPMVDGWMGDDWFHYGAFRQVNFDYFTFMMSGREEGGFVPRGNLDDYETFLRAGSAGDFARVTGLDQLPWWQRLSSHPSYDDFWRDQALDHLIARQPLKIPTMWIQGLWDQEDMWGAIHSYLALKALGTPDAINHLVMGPWRHSQVNADGFGLGTLRFEGDTAAQFRRNVLKPFFDQYLKGGTRADTPPVMIYNTGENHWDQFNNWPASCERGCRSPLKPIFLREGYSLSFDAPGALSAPSDSYVSDPAKPVPYVPRPVRFLDRDEWRRWLVLDQRAVEDRTDVLAYETEPLTAAVRVSGQPWADIYAATSGSDADWVVKLIDVYPGEMPAQSELGGYQLGISMDIFRGRYRTDFANPTPIPPNEVQRYHFILPAVNHVFQPGHRIMVQIQSSWFPLYDRNPQTFVPNIFFARPADYKKATQQIFHRPASASAIWLPLVN